MKKSLVKAAKNLGWIIHDNGEELEFEQSSPLGEDFSFCVSKKNTARDIAEFGGLTMYELKAIYDSRASFYGKAKIAIDGNNKTIYNYGVKVAIIEGDKLTFLTENENHYTTTTLRHIKEFLTQNGIQAGIKSDLLKMARA